MITALVRGTFTFEVDAVCSCVHSMFKHYCWQYLTKARKTSSAASNPKPNMMLEHYLSVSRISYWGNKHFRVGAVFIPDLNQEMIASVPHIIFNAISSWKDDLPVSVRLISRQEARL